jgi:ABC-type transporter Mla subunit MlaD
MAKIKRDTLLGLVFFTGLAVLLMASLNLMDFLSFKFDPIEVRFADAGGIAAGDPVLVLGKRIGKVESVEYDPTVPDHPIKLMLRLQQEVILRRGAERDSATNPVRRARIEIQDSTVLGGKQVWINPMPAVVDRNDETDLVPWTENLVGQTADNVFDAVGQTFSENSKLDRLLDSARLFFDNLSTDNNSVGLLLTRDEFYMELLATVQSLHTTVDDIRDAQGVLGRLVYDEALADDVSQTANGLRRITTSVADGVRGPLARMVNDEAMSTQLGGIVDNVHSVTADLRAGRGPLGMLVQNEEMALRLEETVFLLAEFLRKANDPEAGLIGALMSDEQMREDAGRILGNLSQATDQINSTNGMLGKLINDEELGEQFGRFFNQLARAVEDAREAAPIGTFFQVLAAPF